MNEDNLGLLIDLYELPMCASYFDNKKAEPATFDLYIRKLPLNRSYFIASGLEQALFFLKQVRFTQYARAGFKGKAYIS